MNTLTTYNLMYWTHYAYVQSLHRVHTVLDEVCEIYDFCIASVCVCVHLRVRLLRVAMLIHSKLFIPLPGDCYHDSYMIFWDFPFYSVFERNDGGAGGVLSTYYFTVVFKGINRFLNNRGTSLRVRTVLQ